MSKRSRPRTLGDDAAQAVTRSIRVSPRKLNDVVAGIRGKKVDRALAELTFSRRRIAATVKKTLESAIANAENNHDLDIHELIVAEAHVGKYLGEQLKQAGVSKVLIERPHKKCRVTIYSARPGVVIGKKGADIEKLRKKVSEMTSSEVHLNIVEVRKPEVDATLVAENIAQQ